MTYIWHDKPRPTGTDHVDEASDFSCPARHEVGWLCTRIDGHAGNHQAGIGNSPKSEFAAEWDDTDRGAR